MAFGTPAEGSEINTLTGAPFWLRRRCNRKSSREQPIERVNAVVNSISRGCRSVHRKCDRVVTVIEIAAPVLLSLEVATVLQKRALIQWDRNFALILGKTFWAINIAACNRARSILSTK